MNVADWKTTLLHPDTPTEALRAHLAWEHGIVSEDGEEALKAAHVSLHGLPNLREAPSGQTWTSRWHPPTSGIVGTPGEVDYGRWLDDVWHDAREWTSFCHDGWEHDRCSGCVAWYPEGSTIPTGEPQLPCRCPCHDGGTAGVWTHAHQDEGRLR